MGRPMPRTLLPSREIASTHGKRPLGRKNTETLLERALCPAPPLPVELPGLVRPSASSPKIALKPISGDFAFLDGRLLAGNSEPILLSILAIVAVSQGHGRTLPRSLSV